MSLEGVTAESEAAAAYGAAGGVTHLAAESLSTNHKAQRCGLHFHSRGNCVDDA